ncbi:hypothetical protein J53TS2_14920 [Paenibacillus sp. J53TS2]|nr:hypothetical protein J53TS2_14920 [Paenibacillus sp. J53TS2]
MAQLLIVTNSALNRIKPGWAGTIEGRKRGNRGSLDRIEKFQAAAVSPEYSSLSDL